MKTLFAVLLLTGLVSACSVGDYSGNRGGSGHGGHSHFSSTTDK